MRALASMVVLGACVHPAPGPPGESHVEVFDHPARWVPQFDVLFVVDSTAAMTPYRERVRMLGRYAAGALRSYTAGMPDLHAAVATSPDAPLAILTDVHNPDGSRKTSYAGALEDALAAALDVGTAASAPPQLFDAIERAEANADFARDDASLLIVTLSANDDHSLGAVADYVDALEARDYEPIATGAYAGPAPRLDAFHRALGPVFGPLFTPLDSADYFPTFDPITNIHIDFYEPCLEEPAGPPYECSISMLEGEIETVLPSCESGANGPCWSLVDDPYICFSESARLRTVKVRGYARQYRPHVIGQCIL